MLLVYSCAQPGRLTGGPKDEQPPKILASNPQNGSVNFEGNSLEFSFDEYVDISKASQELVVTPPFDQAPTISMRKLDVKVTWEDSLADQTTYVFNFGEGIVDVNERNPLDSNVFVFSTGPYIDSFEVRGRVIDAFTLQPVEDVLVMLYLENIDSLPLTRLPRYFGKTDASGNYRIGYLTPGTYKIFGLLSENSGYQFDVPTEQVAFSKELITSSSPGDTNAVPFPDLLLFQHADTLQYIVEEKQIGDLGLQFIFNLPTTGFELSEIHGIDTEDWTLQWNKANDTLNIWFPERNDYDSLEVRLRYNDRADTVGFLKPSKFADEKNVPKGFVLKPQRKSISHWEPISLVSESPLGYLDLSRSKLIIDNSDTLDLADAATKKEMELVIDHGWQEGLNYTFFLPDSSICDRFGQCNDTLLVKLKATSKTDFGQLNFRLQLPDQGHAYVVQLLKDSKKRRSKSVSATELVEFTKVPLGTYQVRLIADLNENGKWDPGDYRAGRLPEPVIYFDETLEVRANWVEEVEWIVEP